MVGVAPAESRAHLSAGAKRGQADGYDDAVATAHQGPETSQGPGNRELLRRPGISVASGWRSVKNALV